MSELRRKDAIELLQSYEGMSLVQAAYRQGYEAGAQSQLAKRDEDHDNQVRAEYTQALLHNIGICALCEEPIRVMPNQKWKSKEGKVWHVECDLRQQLQSQLAAAATMREACAPRLENFKTCIEKPVSDPGSMYRGEWTDKKVRSALNSVLPPEKEKWLAERDHKRAEAEIEHIFVCHENKTNPSLHCVCGNCQRLRTLVRETMEADCKRVCESCRKGFVVSVIDEKFIHPGRYAGWHQCDASAIRAAMEKE